MKSVDVGFVDKHGNPLTEGQSVRTTDRTGKPWEGRIVRVDRRQIAEHPFLKEGRTLFAFQSSNRTTWINDKTTPRLWR